MDRIDQLLKKLKDNSQNSFLYNANKLNYNTKLFFSKHTTLTYCSKRILISLLCLFIGISAIFLLTRSALNTEGLLSEAAEKQG
jgi:hypothetical protein